MIEVERQRGLRIDHERDGRIDGETLQFEAIAEAVAALAHCVQSPRSGVARLFAQVDGAAQLVPAAGDEIDRADIGAEYRALGHAVHHATCAAAAEDHAAGALQDFNAFQVVQVAENLRVVTHAVDKKIGGGAVAAQNDLVAVAFALVRQHARNVTEYVGQALHRLVLHQLAWHHAYRGGYFLERLVGLGERRRARCAVPGHRAGSGFRRALNLDFRQRGVFRIREIGKGGENAGRFRLQTMNRTNGRASRIPRPLLISHDSPERQIFGWLTGNPLAG